MHILVWNRVRVGRSEPHTSTKSYGEYPPPSLGMPTLGDLKSEVLFFCTNPSIAIINLFDSYSFPLQWLKSTHHATPPKWPNLSLRKTNPLPLYHILTNPGQIGENRRSQNGPDVLLPLPSTCRITSSMVATCVIFFTGWQNKNCWKTRTKATALVMTELKDMALFWGRKQAVARYRR